MSSPTSFRRNPRLLALLGLTLGVTFAQALAGADSIKVTNHAPFDVFVAIYFVDGTSDNAQPGDARRAGNVVRIAAKKSTRMTRPGRRCEKGGRLVGLCVRYQNRDLYLARTAAELAAKVPKGSLPFVNVANWRGSSYHIAEDGGDLDGHNFLSWGLRKVGLLVAHKYRKELERDPLTKKQAAVRVGISLAAQEKAYLAKRAPRVKAAMEKLLGQKLGARDVPRLAFVASGGGYRAMIATLGYLEGASQLGLLDAATYGAGLSGSTWALAGWLQSSKGVAQYLDSFAPNARHGLHRKVDVKQIIDLVLRRLAFDEPRSIIDVWGSLIAQKILGSKGGVTPTAIDLNTHGARVSRADVLYPIYTAVIDGPVYDWVEFTPHEVGSTKVGSFVPAWAFGRKFQSGRSRNFTPAQPLAFGLGTWGSAVSANVRDLISVFEANIKGALRKRFGPAAGKYFDWLFKKLTGTSVARLRLLPPRVYNWARGLEGKYKNTARLTLVDAGVDFNLPFPPVLRRERGVDVIVTLDASSTASVGEDFKKAADWAKREGLAFPSLAGANLEQECSLHHDTKNPAAPIIVYLPVLLKEKFMGTANFTYSRAQVKQLSGWTSRAMKQCAVLIVKALRTAAARKR